MRITGNGLLSFVVIAALLQAFVIPASAGWVEVDVDGEVSIISQGKIKAVPEHEGDSWQVVDYRNGIVTFVNPEEKSYARAGFDEYCETIRNWVEKVGGAVNLPSDEESARTQFPKVEIVDAGAGDMIAGFQTVKYKVMADGDLYEELWMATEPSLMKEVGDRELMVKLESCVNQQMKFEVTASPDYIQMEQKGWVLRSISYEDGEPLTEIEIVKLEKKQIADSEFEPPDGYTMVPLQKVLGIDQKAPEG